MCKKIHLEDSKEKNNNNKIKFENFSTVSFERQN